LKSRSILILLIQFLFLQLTFRLSLNAQAPNLQFIKLTIDDGLSSSIVSSILQDQRGFVWIATPDGLNRYDGFKFVLYKNVPDDPESLADPVILTLFEDHNKDLLIGTESGLSLYNRQKDSFLNYMSDSSSPLNGLDCSVSRIVEDASGNLWLASSSGLIYFDRKKNSVKRFINDPNNPESISNNNVQSVLIDRFNRIWVTTRRGLNRYIPESQKFIHYTQSEIAAEDLSNTIFIDVIEDHDGNLWFGSTEGLYTLKNSLSNDSHRLKHYQHNKGDKSSLSINQVTSLYVDDSGNLWVGTENGGLNLFNREKKCFWHYRREDFDPQSLNNESIESIYKDRSGNLWIGTYTGGLNIAMKNRDAIIRYVNLPGAPQSLSHNTVTCFLEDSQDKIWIGTDGGGLNNFNYQINRFERFNVDNSSLTSNSILSMIEDSGNRIWLGTWAGGLVRLDKQTRSFKSFTTKNCGIHDNNIFAVSEGYHDDLWLGSFEHGLIHYRIKENKFTDYTPLNSSIGNEMIVKIVKFSKNLLLLGTSSCFQIFSPEEGRFTTYNYNRNNINSLSYPRVTDILVENDTCIWIGTPDGLDRFNPATESFVRFYEKDGLPNNFIKGLAFDTSGTLWVSTNGGVCRFGNKNERTMNFTKADGLQSNEFTERSILKTRRNGSLLMGGTKGFNVLYPEKVVENKAVPDILITDLKIFNKIVRPGHLNSPLKQNITESRSLTLSYEHSVITFDYAVMDFSAPEKNRYAYMLENFDKGWIFPETRGEATYTNLNPGKYLFRVKGSNNDGVWNEKGTSLEIIILPPWWNTWWFRVTIISFVVLLFVLLYISRVRQLKKQKILLEMTVAAKTMELKELNASKDKFFSIIAHDLKNPFTTIIGFSEILKEEINRNRAEKVKIYANLINSSAVQTFQLLENLLDWANSQRGNISFNPDTINIAEILTEETAILNDMAVKKNIELKRSFNSDISIFADKNMISTILRNLISNAIKFTHRNGRVEVSALICNSNVEIAVSDNGIGMSADTISKLFRIDENISINGTENEKGTGLGLFLCNEFANTHGGKICVESNPGNGSIFKLILPIDRSAFE
jgi:signal transduction histidine kinase/ligand-binding sensor domain-containing protein